MVLWVLMEMPSSAQVELFLLKCPWVIIDGIVEGGYVLLAVCLGGEGICPGSQDSEEVWVRFIFVDNS